MTNPDYTHLLLIVDRSGSMTNIAQDMNGGIRTLLQEQGQEPGDLLIDAWTFDSKIDHVAEAVAWDDVSLRNLVQPRNATALFDAIGSAVGNLGAQFAGLIEESRPGKVVVAIVTDGYENASMEWTAEAVKALIEQQQNDYSWQFLFLGANQDAVMAGQSLGVPMEQSVTFNASAAGTANTWSATSRNLAAYRSGGAQTMDYTDDDRVQSLAE